MGDNRGGGRGGGERGGRAREGGGKGEGPDSQNQRTTHACSGNINKLKTLIPDYNVGI